MNTIDFSRSYAILVGTGHYTHGLDEMPQAINSLTAMRELLTGPLCGWPESRVKVFEDKTTLDGVDTEIAELIHDTTDVLLFYYVGHGQLLAGDHLGMALADTQSAPESRRSTSLRLNDVREELRTYCKARVKLVILDCCFSGLATKNTQGASRVDQLELTTKVEGAYTLTASRYWQTARHEEDPDGLTYFTRVFTEVVWDGIPCKGRDLTLEDIHEEVARRLQKLELPGEGIPPEPSTLVVDNAEELVFARNAAVSGPQSSGLGRRSARRSPSPTRRRRYAITAAATAVVFIIVFAAATLYTITIPERAIATTIATTIATALAALSALAATESTARRRSAIAAAVVFIVVFIAFTLISAFFNSANTIATIVATIAATIAAITSVVATENRRSATTVVFAATAIVVFATIATIYAATTVFTKTDALLTILAIALIAAFHAAAAAIGAAAIGAVVMALFGAIWKAADYRIDRRK